jgi:hypothetical protein
MLEPWLTKKHNSTKLDALGADTTFHQTPLVRTKQERKLVPGRDGNRGSALHVVAGTGSEEKHAAAHLPGARRDEDGRAPSRARPRRGRALATRPSGRGEQNGLGSWPSGRPGPGWAAELSPPLTQPDSSLLSIEKIFVDTIERIQYGIQGVKKNTVWNSIRPLMHMLLYQKIYSKLSQKFGNFFACSSP